MVQIIKKVENPFEKAKRERLVWLGNFMRGNIGVNYLDLLAILQKRFGVSLKTAREYITVCIRGSGLYWKEKILTKEIIE